MLHQVYLRYGDKGAPLKKWASGLKAQTNFADVFIEERAAFMKHADDIVANVRSLTEATGLDVHEGIELLEIFCDTTRADLGRMREGLCAGDLQEVYRRAHSIKGAALNLSLHAVASAAAAVEGCARAGDNDRLTFLFVALVRRFDAVLRFLKTAEL